MIGNDLNLIPYVELDGAWTLSDKMMRHVWGRMEAEGTYQDVFHGGEIVNDDRFLSFVKTRTNAVVTVWTLQDIVLLAWLNGVEKNHALAHFCTFRSVSRDRKLEAGKMVTDYWLGFRTNDGPWFSVICGLVPAYNKAAIKFARDLGWQVSGMIPRLIRHFYRQEDVDAVMVYKENENGKRGT